MDEHGLTEAEWIAAIKALDDEALKSIEKNNAVALRLLHRMTLTLIRRLRTELGDAAAAESISEWERQLEADPGQAPAASDGSNGKGGAGDPTEDV